MPDLLVLRHAQAEDSAACDFERVLTPKGKKQARAVGRFCSAHGLVPALILTSPVVRAFATAELVAGAMGTNPTIIPVPSLACGASPEDIFSTIREHADVAGCILIVGHQPDLGDFLASALGCEGNAITLKKASLARLDLPAIRRGAAVLDFLLPVRLMANGSC